MDAGTDKGDAFNFNYILFESLRYVIQYVFLGSRMKTGPKQRHNNHFPKGAKAVTVITANETPSFLP